MNLITVCSALEFVSSIDAFKLFRSIKEGKLGAPIWSLQFLINRDIRAAGNSACDKVIRAPPGQLRFRGQFKTNLGASLSIQCRCNSIPRKLTDAANNPSEKVHM